MEMIVNAKAENQIDVEIQLAKTKLKVSVNNADLRIRQETLADYLPIVRASFVYVDVFRTLAQQPFGLISDASSGLEDPPILNRNP